MSRKEIRVIEPSIAEAVASPEMEYIETSNKVLTTSINLLGKDQNGKFVFHENPANLLYISSHGLGKTLMVATLRKKLSDMVGFEIPMVTVDCSQELKEYKLKGTVMGVGDETPFVLGSITGAITLANKTGVAILDLEEINSLTPGSQKSLNSITDWRESVYVEMLAKKYSLDANAKLIIVATMNPSGYGGVFSLNQDLRSRFSDFLIEYPSTDDQNTILAALHPNVPKSVRERLNLLVTEIRDKATPFSFEIGTRNLSRLLQNYENTGDLELALRIDLVNKFSGTERSTVIDRVNAHFDTNISE